jgi:hypothetical protein
MTKNVPGDLTTGRMTVRLECKITEGLDAEITQVAKILAGNGDPRMFRSRAVRQLLMDGVRARADRVPEKPTARRARGRRAE